MSNDFERRLREAAAFDPLATENKPTPKAKDGFWKGVVFGIVGTLVVAWAYHAYQVHQMEQAMKTFLGVN